MKIVIFEDEGYKNLLPLVYFRPVWELRCGARTLKDKITGNLKTGSCQFVARPYLSKYYLEKESVFRFADNSEMLFVNGRLLAKSESAFNFHDFSENSAFVMNSSVIAFRLNGHSAKKFFHEGLLQTEKLLNEIKPTEVRLPLIEYPWDLIDENGTELVADFNHCLKGGQLEGRVDDGVHFLEKQNVYLSREARIMPGVVVNAEHGPVWIDDNAKIMPGAIVEGPLYIGKNSSIKCGAKVYQNTSVGPVCKVGGEVEESIFQSYTNKQHEGFLGHSYLGSWINIGADTNNSDLKNNYGEITVSINGTPVETGKQFVGLIMGDHSKTAINTMFNTGTVVGVNCNIYGEGFPPKFLPSFSWGGSGGLRQYNFEKAIDVAKAVMSRRNIVFNNNHYQLFKIILETALTVENRVRIR